MQIWRRRGRERSGLHQHGQRLVASVTRTQRLRRRRNRRERLLGAVVVVGAVFECRTCNRQFPSFQALGGHRASHKKPRLDGHGHGHGQAQAGAAAKRRVHECPICGVEFAVGQALGGHMRRHRAPTTGVILAPEKPVERRGKLLDLNWPPSENDTKLGPGSEVMD
ncbi:unnamed protein product [Musa textilis]